MLQPLPDYSYITIGYNNETEQTRRKTENKMEEKERTQMKITINWKIKESGMVFCCLSHYFMLFSMYDKHFQNSHRIINMWSRVCNAFVQTTFVHSEYHANNKKNNNLYSRSHPHLHSICINVTWRQTTYGK